jgi:hypothetical protein
MSGAPRSTQHGVPSGHGVSRVVIPHLDLSIVYSMDPTLALHNSEVIPAGKIPSRLVGGHQLQHWVSHVQQNEPAGSLLACVPSSPSDTSRPARTSGPQRSHASFMSVSRQEPASGLKLSGFRASPQAGIRSTGGRSPRRTGAPAICRTKSSNLLDLSSLTSQGLPTAPVPGMRAVPRGGCPGFRPIANSLLNSAGARSFPVARTGR